MRARFAGRVLPIDVAVANRWGLLAAGAKKEGKALSTIDGLIAATAVDHNLTVVSQNASDFANERSPGVEKTLPAGFTLKGLTSAMSWDLASRGEPSQLS
jgi:predicted nucleic acid-binding protein